MTLTRFDVFIPGDFPEHTYIHRRFHNARTGLPRDPEEEVREALQQKGRIVQVAGPSKSGKTIALESILTPARLVTVPGSRVTSSDSLWLAVISHLGLPMHRVQETSCGESNEREFGAGAKANLVAAEFSGEVKHKHGDRADTAEQLTYSQDLFKLATNGLLQKDLVLFIDDFHTMDEATKPSVAVQIKAAAEVGVKICLAEVPHRADEPISANPDLTGRVAKVIFEYWSEADLKEIGRVGFDKLGVEIADSTLVALSAEAGGSPQLMQLFCLQAAKVLGVESTQTPKRSLSMTPAQLEIVFINVVQEVEREAIFRILDNGPDERGKLRNKYPAKGLGEADNYEITLAAVALDPPRMAFSWDQGDGNLVSRMDRILISADKRPRREQITRALDQMVELAREHMPKIVVLDWEMTKGLHILDPYFLFYLRWSEKYMAARTAANP